MFEWGMQAASDDSLSSSSEPLLTSLLQVLTPQLHLLCVGRQGACSGQSPSQLPITRFNKRIIKVMARSRSSISSTCSPLLSLGNARRKAGPSVASPKCSPLQAAGVLESRPPARVFKRPTCVRCPHLPASSFTPPSRN